MELQNYINTHTNYISEFRNNGLKINTYKRLKIISYSYDNPPEYDKDNLWKLYCRGAVVTPENKVICLPPIKSIELQNMNDSIPQNGELKYENLIDGTMVNLFYYNNEWLISTRSEIGGYNKWNNKKSFRQMFDECSTIDYDLLDKNMSYSFVMRHTENRNVSPIKENELYLVEVYQYTDSEIKRIPISEYPDNLYRRNESYTDREEFLTNYQGPVIPYQVKGFTVKVGSLRYKWINPYFTEVKNLKINMNNHLLNYIELRRNGNLKKYLRYFPEHQHLFNNYKEKIHTLSNDLYNTYKNVFIHKTTDKNEIPYHLKPLIYDVHKNYLSNKNPTTWIDIKDYIHSIPSKKLTFSLNYC